MKKRKKQQIPWNLILAKLEGYINEPNEQILRKWITDEKNIELYKEISDLWSSVQARTRNYTPNTDYYWKRLSGKLQLSTPQRTKISILPHYIHKIAACIIFLIVSSLSFYSGLNWVSNDNNQSEQRYENISGKARVVLPDGSTVWLHSHTILSYNTDFRKNGRKVKLEGEAFFDVTKNPQEQFIVHVRGIDIKVYGTKFNVSSMPNAEEVNVSLLSGSVSLTDNSTLKEQFLLPGETATYRKKERNFSITSGMADINAAWATSTVQFSNNTLIEICSVLSKRFDIKILVNSNMERKHVYTFTLHDEKIEEILKLMSCIHPIKYSYGKDGVLNIAE